MCRPPVKLDQYNHDQTKSTTVSPDIASGFARRKYQVVAGLVGLSSFYAFVGWFFRDAVSRSALFVQQLRKIRRGSGFGSDTNQQVKSTVALLVSIDSPTPLPASRFGEPPMIQSRDWRILFCLFEHTTRIDHSQLFSKLVAWRAIVDGKNHKRRQNKRKTHNKQSTNTFSHTTLAHQRPGSNPQTNCARRTTWSSATLASPGVADRNSLPLR
mmetsp:Transcript_3725/g.8125  ORF Transcript_3725/g.8125 Transcript_3725/m.8125 type:complete len:213 (+) Transcript_3725:534-1172(+)